MPPQATHNFIVDKTDLALQLGKAILFGLTCFDLTGIYNVQRSRAVESDTVVMGSGGCCQGQVF